MDNNDSNIKSQPTGGLKIMTVFIVVLALHVAVIGSIIGYRLMSGGNNDADLTTTDKTHKDSRNADGSTIVADGTLPDAIQADKSAPAPTAPTEVATIPANPPTTAPASDAAAPTVATTSTPAPTPAPAVAQASAPVVPALQPMNPATSTEVTEPGSQTPTGPISPELAPPAETAPASLTQAPVEPAPSVPLTSGPVHMPPVEAAAPAPQTIHVVKITDSYKKIAHRYHITVAELKEANHIHNDILHTGQKLIIPSEKNVAADSAPMSTSSLAAAPTGPVPSDPAPTASLVSSSSTVAATGLHHHLYTVVKGDTLIRIAHRFKTTAKALMAENGITDPTKLAIGKKLRIPSEESRSATNGAPASTQPSPAQAKQGTPTAQLANYVH